jgi:hypothetical protein
MASFIFLVFAFLCGAYLTRMCVCGEIEKLKLPSWLRLKTDLIQQYAKQALRYLS